MLRQAPGTPRLASVKPPFLFNHPLSALWVGALQVSGNAEGYRKSATFHGKQCFSLPFNLSDRHTGREPFTICSSVGGSFLGFSRCPLWHYDSPLIKHTDKEVPSCLTEV